jgi:hypothetical protein
VRWAPARGVSTPVVEDLSSGRVLIHGMDETKGGRPEADAPVEGLIERASRLLPIVIRDHARLFELLS